MTKDTGNINIRIKRRTMVLVIPKRNDMFFQALKNVTVLFY